MESGEELFGSVYERGAVIFRQGEPGDKMYVIQSGAVEISRKQGESETVLTILGKGEFFGETALFQEEQRSATVIAIRPTRLLPLTRSSLLERVSRDPGVTFHLLKGLILKIQRTDRQVKQTVGVELAADRAKEAFADISLRELADIWDVEQASIWFEPGENVFLEGAIGDAMYIVLTGTVEISQGAGQSRFVQRRLGPGDLLGEWAIITDGPRFSTATATTRTQLMFISRQDFAEQVAARPELALYIIQDLVSRLRHLSMILADPVASADAVRRSWRPLLKRLEPAQVSIVSLSTCAGCSAVLLDDQVLAQVLETANIVYCPLLMDQDVIPEADVALVDGVVRLKEDAEKLQEARIKSRFLVAWGTCAAFGGIPAEANRFELEDLIEETYSHTDDAFAYYLSGRGGVGRTTYQQEGIALLRQAYKLDDFVRVDYYVPGCPPAVGMLQQLLGELIGKGLGEAQSVVCRQCSRKPTKTPVADLVAYPRGETGLTCLNSLGVLCMGFLTQGGCGAVCPQHGLPCWGCRGPAKSVLNKMSGGDSFEEVAIASLARRCRLEEDVVRSAVKRLRQQGHQLFDFEQRLAGSAGRVR
ncbi:MAG: cyclic nucleotide-binding domain-containing protein [Chloroflexi bacterium]|nr:cyclic nucleotide-binding domain-containing protein [Chloroflexota bacterium]MBU1746469.1 cyclic nucleotide-binding domain-containing protein [Chloroflexota bacterium]MBU1879464.1 cyclic nucleotide-binding domain-containing protein [Chloroflexota bacterium]